MGKLMKGGIPYGGVADIDITKEDVVLTMGEIPSNPRDGMTILYEGDTTQDFTNGHVYQYSEEDSEWLDILSVKSIPTEEIESLFE